MCVALGAEVQGHHPKRLTCAFCALFENALITQQNKFEVVTRPDVPGGCGCGEEVETAAVAAPLPLPLPPPRGPTDPPYEPPLVFPPPPLCPLPPPLDCGGGIMACSDDIAVGGDMLKLLEERKILGLQGNDTNPDLTQTFVQV